MASKITVNLDTSKENYLLEKCIQYDDITLEANIFENGVKKDLTNHAVVINVIKPDGTFVTEAVEASGIVENKITKLMNEQTTTAYGIGKVMITLTDNAQLQNSTFEFKLDIKKFVTEGAVASAIAVPIVKELTDKVAEAIKAKNDTDAVIKGGNAATKAELDAKPDGVSVYTGTNSNNLNTTTGNATGKKDDVFIGKNGDVFIKGTDTAWGNKVGEIPTEIVNDLITDSADGGDTKALSATQGTVLNNKMYSRAVHPVRNIVSFYLDDAPLTDYTVIKPIADAEGIQFTVGVIADAVGSPNQMTLAQLLELQEAGWDMHSHCLTNVDLSKMSVAEQETQLKESKRKLLDMGLKAECILYPQGFYNANTMEIARKYYRAGFASSVYEWKENKSPIRTFDLGRIPLEETTYTIDLIKQNINNMNNQWYIFYCHSATMAPEVLEKLKQVIAHVKQNGIEIMTCSQALDVFENRVDVGDIGEWRDTAGLKTDTKNQYFKIGADGTLESNPAFSHVHGGNIAVTKDTPITDFLKNKVTTRSFNQADASGIPFPTRYAEANGTLPTLQANGIGTLVTYRLHDEETLSFQEFYDVDNTMSARRRWDSGTNKWKDWVTFSSDAILANDILPRERSLTNIKSATNIDYFPKDRVHYATFLQGQSDIPFDQSIGTLATYRLGADDALSYQTWKGKISNNIYTRHWITDSASWSDWDTPFRVKETILEYDFNIIQPNNPIVQTFTINGLEPHGAIICTFTGGLPTGVISEVGCSAKNTLILKLYNITNSQVQLGKRSFYVAQTYYKN